MKGSLQGIPLNDISFLTNPISLHLDFLTCGLQDKCAPNK